jgi:hypothetical protein
MQYRLSTLFLVFFFVAATLALFGVFGIWAAVVMLLIAFCLHRAKKLTNGIQLGVVLLFMGIICPGLMQFSSNVHNSALASICPLHMKYIAIALKEYTTEKREQLPLCSKNAKGEPLYSWRVELLPYLEQKDIYSQVNKDEFWNSSKNSKIQVFDTYDCPSDYNGFRTQATNYVAVIGPGTAWRDGHKVFPSQLPHEGFFTVSVIEMLDTGIHWAEPRDLTVEEVLERIKAQKETSAFANHPKVNVLFADGTVRQLSENLPLAMWQKLFDGKIDDFNDLEPSSIVSVKIYASFVVWLFAIILLFRRAIKSRKRPSVQPTELGHAPTS